MRSRASNPGRACAADMIAITGKPYVSPAFGASSANMPCMAEANTCCGVAIIFVRISSRCAGVVFAENIPSIIFLHRLFVIRLAKGTQEGLHLRLLPGPLRVVLRGLRHVGVHQHQRFRLGRKQAQEGERHRPAHAVPHQHGALDTPASRITASMARANRSCVYATSGLSLCPCPGKSTSSARRFSYTGACPRQNVRSQVQP